MSVFAIDFGRPNGDESFQDLVASGVAGHPVIRLRPPGLVRSSRTPLSAAAYAGYYQKEIERSGVAPRAVLGYCAGGLFAYELCARLREQEHRDIALVMLDTVATGPRHVANEFARGLRDIGWSEQTAFGVDLPAAQETALTMLERNLVEGLDFLRQVTARFVTGFLSTNGVDADALDGLTAVMLGRQSAALRYIAASTVRTAERPAISGAVIVSKSLADEAEAFWADSAALVYVMDCDHRHLLRDESAQRYLVKMLTGDGAPSTDEGTNRKRLP